MESVYLLSLGCSRNLLDSEVLLGMLKQRGFSASASPDGADVAIINTCGFIKEAKEESIGYILQLADMKRAGRVKKLIVSGCLAQRYPAELVDRVKEIDGVFGSSDFAEIPQAVGALSSGKKLKKISREPGFLYDHGYKRELLTPPHYAYIKIQEGCSNNCSYCVIPALKGARRSRGIESVLQEARLLKHERGVKELILVGQDTTSFGMDTDGKPLLPELLRRTAAVVKDGWVRFLYTHPAHFTDELIDVMEGCDNICRYCDLPIQHINNRILRKMNRRTTKDAVRFLIERLRKRVKNLTIRTTIIVGFPGETDEEFRELMDFLEEIRFERLGAFVYSAEEGTAAAGFGRQIPEKIKMERFDEIMRLQQKLSAENNKALVGGRLRVLVDEKDPAQSDRYMARSQMDAPEVDGVIYVNGDGIEPGDFIDVRITGSAEYDLIGEPATHTAPIRATRYE